MTLTPAGQPLGTRHTDPRHAAGQWHPDRGDLPPDHQGGGPRPPLGDDLTANSRPVLRGPGRAAPADAAPHPARPGAAPTPDRGAGVGAHQLPVRATSQDPARAGTAGGAPWVP